MTAPIQPTGMQEGTMGGVRATPLTPVQKMRANLQWLRERGASTEEQAAEIDRWRPKIEAYNRAEQSQAGSLGNLVAQGATFNFADEIAGAADAAGAMVPGGQSPGEAYRSTRDALRGTNAALRAERPGAALASELGGSLASGVGTGVAAARAVPGALAPVVTALTPATRLGRIGATVGGGAAAGGLAGAGGAEEGNRLRGAAMGAATGAAVAGGLQAGGAAAGQVARRLGFGPRATGTVAGNVQQAVGLPTAEDVARERVLDVVERRGRTLEDVLGPSATADPTDLLMDVVGPKGPRAVGTAKRLGEKAPERIEEALGARARDRGVTLAGELTRRTGTGAFNPEQAADDLIQQARTAARPLYDELRQFAAVSDPRVNEAMALIPEERVAGLWRRIRNIAKADGRNLTRRIIDDEGKLLYDLEPSEIDLVKRALDEDLYEGGRAAKLSQPGGLSNTETRLLMDARQKLVQAADDATGGLYARARAAYGGPVAIREALEQGRDLRTMTQAELETALADFTDAQRQAFARGGIQATRDFLATMPEGRTGIARGFTSPQREAQLGALFDDPAKAEDFNRLIRREVGRETNERTVMGNSATAERLADDEMARLATQVPTSLVGMAVEGAKRLGERVLRGQTAAEVDAVAQVLTESVGTPADRAKILRYLRAGKTARAQQAANAALRRSAVGGVAGGRAGTSAGGQP